MVLADSNSCMKQAGSAVSLISTASLRHRIGQKSNIFCVKKAEIRRLQFIFKGKRTTFSLSAGGFQY